MQPEKKNHVHHHHILSHQLAITIGLVLLAFTGLTVWTASKDLGWANFPIAMLIATTKAILVSLFFMNLFYDRKENAVIFTTAFLFLAIFLTFTVTDIFFRGDVYVKKGALVPVVQPKSKFKKPWISTPQLVSHGKELFQVQCVSCHGSQGRGDGPAATALIPKPRDFTSPTGWKNGRKPSQVFKSLKEGLPGSSMASFATLPADDRWALVHYVLSLEPTAPQDTPEDLARVGIDVTREGGGGETEAPTISIEQAMKLLVQEAKKPQH